MTLSANSRDSRDESREASSGPAHMGHMEHGPPRVSIAKTYTFEAAHRLLEHEGPCANLHGHSYVLEVEVIGEVFFLQGHTDDGMVLDFATLDKIVKGVVIDRVDHTYLNDVLSFRPTAENMVCHFAKEISRALIDIEGVRLTQLVLWETSKGRAIWRSRPS